MFAGGEFAGKIVERSTEAVDAVSGDEARLDRRLDNVRVKDLLATLGIEFSPESMRLFLEPSVPFRSKARQAVECPVEPPLVGAVHG